MEGVPYLRAGQGERPQDGGCILQVISWMDHGGWHDNPQCVLQPLRSLAIEANDGLDDGRRQGLLDLAPRLRGTAYAPLLNNKGDLIQALTKEQEAFNKRAAAWMSEWFNEHPRGREVAENECDDPTCECHEYKSYNEYPETNLEYLTRALDAYEAEFGKQKPMWFDQVDWQPIYNYLKQIEQDGLPSDRELPLTQVR